MLEFPPTFAVTLIRSYAMFDVFVRNFVSLDDDFKLLWFSLEERLLSCKYDQLNVVPIPLCC